MRVIVKIIESICKKENIVLNSFSYDWILHLKKGDVNRYIIGYDFELNSSSVNLILKDKSATSDILEFNNIPHVEHRLFMTPSREDYVGKSGNWESMIQFAKKYDYHLVCKYNFGTGGESVIRIHNQLELEKATHQIFEKESYICLSKYYDIEEEYRAIYLNGKIKIAYKKIRPSIIGDGKNTVRELLLCNNIKIDSNILNFILENQIDLEKVYDREEKILLNWKHNLGQGSTAMIETDKETIKNLEDIINSIVGVLDIKFASFDIIKVDNQLMVLEINAGIMMEKFAMQSEENFNIAYKIYEEAVMKMLNK